MTTATKQSMPAALDTQNQHPKPHPKVRRESGQWVLTLTQWLPLPPAELFPFFSDAHNLEKLTPPLLRFEVLTPRPIQMGTGTLLDYRLRLRGFPIRWRTRILDWNPPYGFVDEQLKGPYVRWYHTHTFVSAAGPGGQPGTRCDDRVEYRPPGRAIAPLVNRLVVQRDVEKIFRYRAQILADLFADGRMIQADGLEGLDASIG